MRRLIPLLFALTACSGGGDTAPVTPPPTPTIAVSLSPAAGTAARGASVTTAVSLARGGGYAGSVTLGADGVPAGVTVTFSPASLTAGTSSATATIAIGAGAAPGTPTFSITATGSGVSPASAPFALTIPAPAITVAAASTALSVTQGTSGNVGVTITRVNGFAEAVSLSTSALPNGVTATFAPASLAAGATSSTLVFAVTSAAAAGSYPITITAAGNGVASVTTSVTLTVVAAATPAFSLSASPAALNLTAGQSGASVITAIRTGGFAGEVALAVSGAPAGMTVALQPTAIPAASTTAALTVATTAATPPGTHTLTIAGTGTGVQAQSTSIAVTVAAPPGITLTSSAATASGAAGGSATVGVTLARQGNYTGDVTLAVQGMPSGVTAAFAPAVLTGGTLSATLTLTIGAAVAPGTYALTLAATGPGSVSAQAPLTLAVTAAQGYTLSATSVSLAQGGTGTSTVTVTRTGGFSGTVNLAVSGLPSGVTATVNPAAVTGTSATITFTATSGAATGAFSATVTGTATGLTNVTATVAGTVTPGGGSGTGNVNWRFCDPTELPLFFAFRAGTSGAWTRVLPSANNTYSFSLGGPGSVVFVLPTTNGVANTFQYNFTAAEMEGTAEFECTRNPANKTLTGTVAGLSGTQSAQISVGGTSASITSPATAFTINNVATGTTDLLAFRSQQTVGSNFIPTIVPDRAILRRSVDYAAGSAIPVLDFNGSEAFTPASATYTLAGAGGGEITQILSFLNTANGTSAGFLFGALLNTSGTATLYGVPTSRLVSGDFHFAIGLSVAQDGSNQRGVYQYNRELSNRTLTLGPQLTTPTVSTLGTAPYARLRSAGSWQAEYADGLGVTFSQGTNATNTRSWTIAQSRGFTTGTAYQLEIPDLSGTTGWNNTWGLVGGLQTTVSTSANGGTVLATISPSEGAAFRQAARTTQVTP